MAQNPAETISKERDLIKTRVTIQKYLLDRFREFQSLPNAPTGEFMSLMMDLVSATKMIAMYVNKGPKMGVFGVLDGCANVTGDLQKPLDVLSNDIMTHLMSSSTVRAMVSEELKEPLIFQSARGKYLLATDPLDGSSNIDVNVSVGTIFSVLPAPPPGTPVTTEHFLQAGRNQIAAGYVLYGPQTTMVFAVRDPRDPPGSLAHSVVNAFTLDNDVGEYFLTTPNMQIPPSTNEFAINCSRQRHWEPAVARYISECQQGKEGPRGKDFNMRWVGSMVADVHRILNRGGIFLYPGDRSLYKAGETGKLRLLYEVNPMAFLVEAAGGLAVTGRVPCLDIIPDKIHAKSAVILGSKEEVERVLQYHREQDQAQPPPDPVRAIRTVS